MYGHNIKLLNIDRCVEVETAKREMATNVDKVSHRGCQLRSAVVCYDPSVPHELSLILTMYI
jgi:hypothetical protein